MPTNNPEAQPQSKPDERAVETRQAQLERKLFDLSCNQNHLGRFLRISETIHQPRHSVILPESGIVPFLAALDDLLQAARKPGVEQR